MIKKRIRIIIISRNNLWERGVNFLFQKNNKHTNKKSLEDNIKKDNQINQKIWRFNKKEDYEIFKLQIQLYQNTLNNNEKVYKNIWFKLNNEEWI